MANRRHSWEFQSRGYGHETHRCRQCGLVRQRRHAVNHHWTEWIVPTGAYLPLQDKTPPCMDWLLYVPPPAAADGV